MVISKQEIEEMRSVPFQRRFFPLPDLSVVTAWFDGQGALRLTRNENPATLKEEVMEEVGVGVRNDP